MANTGMEIFIKVLNN